MKIISNLLKTPIKNPRDRFRYIISINNIRARENISRSFQKLDLDLEKCEKHKKNMENFSKHSNWCLRVFSKLFTTKT